MIDIDKIRKNSKLTRDGFYHVVGAHYCVREAEFDALVAEVERLRGERASVVAWLRARNFLEWEADAIERGEHHREEEP